MLINFHCWRRARFGYLSCDLGRRTTLGAKCPYNPYSFMCWNPTGPPLHFHVTHVKGYALDDRLSLLSFRGSSRYWTGIGRLDWKALQGQLLLPAQFLWTLAVMLLRIDLIYLYLSKDRWIDLLLRLKFQQPICSGCYYIFNHMVVFAKLAFIDFLLPLLIQNTIINTVSITKASSLLWLEGKQH